MDDFGCPALSQACPLSSDDLGNERSLEDLLAIAESDDDPQPLDLS